MTSARARAALRLLQPLLRRSLRRHLGGRMVDPDDEARGRFLKADVDRVAEHFVEGGTAMLSAASIEDLPTRGSRLNVVLTVLTVALYRALVRDEVPRDHAIGLTSDVVWHFYAIGGRTVRVVAGFRHRDPHERMVAALRMLLRFPFAAPGRPAYEVSVSDEGDEFLTSWTWCPPHAFVRDLINADGDGGELEVFRRTWCSFDWAFNDLLAGGEGTYTRPHTMSDGDPMCDMTWRVGTPVEIDSSAVVDESASPADAGA